MKSALIVAQDTLTSKGVFSFGGQKNFLYHYTNLLSQR